MSVDEATLVAAIEAAPDDEAPQLVYMDWLLDRGDPRGALIEMQLARLRDPDWARPRLERRARALEYRVGSLDIRRLFDRGMPGLDVDLLREPSLDTFDVRWLKPAISNPYVNPADVDAAIARLCDSRLWPQIRRLDLSGWKLPSWTRILDSSARPRHLVLPPDAAKHVAALREAPLCSQVERLELRGAFDAAAFDELLAAPWIENVVEISLTARPTDEYWWMSRALDPIGDAGLAMLAVRARRLRSLDARYHPVTDEGLRSLAGSARALTSLQLTADDFDASAFAALARSRLAAITRLSLAGPWLYSVDPVLQLVRSPCWDGRLDLTRLTSRDLSGDYVDRTTQILAALEDHPVVDGASPLVSLVVGRADGFARFAEAPLARTLRHVTGAWLGSDLGSSEIRLASLRLVSPQAHVLGSYLRSPIVERLQRLAMLNAQARAIATLAQSALRPVDIHVTGGSNTEATAALVRSPVLERVVDLSLEVDGNHAAKTVSAALVDTPYLQEVQRLELGFLEKFPGRYLDAIRGRYGAVLR